jgi:hypothetical protein
MRSTWPSCYRFFAVSPALDNVKGAFYDRNYVLELSHGALPSDALVLGDVMSKQVISAHAETSVKKYVATASPPGVFLVLFRLGVCV